MQIHTKTHDLNESTLACIEHARAYRDDTDPWVRGLVATRVYRENPEMSPVAKQAEVLARTLEVLEPPVIDESLIAGSVLRRLRVHGGVSESDGWRIDALFPEFGGSVDSPELPDHVRAEYAYWREDLPLRRRFDSNPARQANRWISRYGIAGPHGYQGAHTMPDLGILLKYGIGPLLRRTQENAIRAENTIGPANDSESAGRDEAAAQFRAMARCLEGLRVHILRCADAAQRRADELDRPEHDAEVVSRLRLVAANCRHVADAPPETFPQAVQLLYFGNLADGLSTRGDANSYGRADMLLLPFYRRDLEEGRITREEAFEWVTHLIVKTWSDQQSKNITLGGIAPDGSDGTNDLSCMFLEAMEDTGLAVALTVRIHPKTPEEFLDLTARVLRRDFGRPSVFNDDVAIPALIEHGVEPEDARDYAPLGCVEVSIPGRSTGRTMCFGLNPVKVLELVLNRGRCLVTGDVVWDDVPETFASYDDLLAEYRRRTAAVIAAGCEIIREDERLEPSIEPRPWLTILSRGGIDDGRDMAAGQPKYDTVGVTLDGVADLADSLNAVRRLCFRSNGPGIDENIDHIGLEKLREVLAADWAGYEDLRLKVINTFPRFGQDDPEINRIATEEATFFAECFHDEPTAYGGRFLPMVFGVTTGLLTGHGPKTGASPSGRRAGTILTASLAPNTQGPQGCATEVLSSAAAVPGRLFPGGISNVQDFDPSLVQGEAGLENIKRLIRGYFTLGGIELSMNFLSAEKLRDAQVHPELYPEMRVRLFGMSARFISLSAELQETVINRIEAAHARG